MRFRPLPLLVAVFACGLAACQRSGDAYEVVHGDESTGDALLSLQIRGPILGAPADGQPLATYFGQGVTYGYRIQDQLAEAAERDDVKGVLLRLQTPGGTIFGSNAIHEGVSSYRERTGRPVVAFVEGLSASGGVWAMVGADAIYADHGSLVGSIGVIGGVLAYYDKPTAIDGGLLGGGITTEGGIEFLFVTAGRGKDYGNPFRRPSDEELAVIQQGVDNEYARFVAHVARERELEEATVRERIAALVYDNATAQDLGLIDGTRSRDEALEELAKLAGVGDAYKVIRPADPPAGLLGQLLADADVAERRLAAVRAAVMRDRCALGPRAVLAWWGDPRALCPGGAALPSAR